MRDNKNKLNYIGELQEGDKNAMKLELKVKYFEGQDKKLGFIKNGDWVDLYANEDVFIPKGEMRLVPLGVAIKLPEGYEAILAPRSSTYKTWGVIQTNSIGVIDESYCGDSDQWMIPLMCMNEVEQLSIDAGFAKPIIVKGSYIRKGDKIAQFRIQEKMPRNDISIIEVDTMDDASRGGFGTTGTK